jgi:hypothetical protein
VHPMLQVCHPSSNWLAATGVAAVGDLKPTSLAKLYGHIQHANLGISTPTTHALTSHSHQGASAMGASAGPALKYDDFATPAWPALWASRWR